ncbi:MAG TPA: GTPase ObgE [Nitrospinaceae bacterium]|jgi:GTP-binding protein|nr:GTPase ObgE [Nitrospinota bacterium]MDP6334744.1 GTPase ObgE [Nitrospinaceae bacterium]HAX46391.1 GTPase ObgE [Nitrospina sp.]MBV51164.1 GTPase ObgE [Nitrospinota bacterium]MDP7147377.1 GTPase ObgE [Nitrospinaceae bacterium]|tara:strand:- start:6146 stop:7171 length:1026 start_codon:yes stop_codon:yes gene_type:complete
MFIDEVNISIQAGDGGSGCCSFRREKFVPLGGPDGGDGGNGGDIIFEADAHLSTLTDLKNNRLYKAENGCSGKSKTMTGRRGKHLVVKVPAGTLVRDEATRDLLVDLTENNMQFVAAHGGKGGRGNTRFKTSRNRAPRQFDTGVETEEKKLFLELKLLADVAVIGLPNAGKSTFISKISHARPKIADYPFTTLIPNLGVVQLDDFSTFVAADIPGLIEGAHKGKGLGIRFLKHTERSRLLVHLLDFSVSNLRDPLDDYRIVQNELEQFSKSLYERPQILVASKIDHPEAVEKFQEYESRLKEISPEVFSISSMTGEGVPKLLWKIKEMLDRLKSEELASSS